MGHSHVIGHVGENRGLHEVARWCLAADRMIESFSCPQGDLGSFRQGVSGHLFHLVQTTCNRNGTHRGLGCHPMSYSKGLCPLNELSDDCVIDVFMYVYMIGGDACLS